MRFCLVFLFLLNCCILNGFEPFTVKVVRNKVRVRLSPDLEGKIIRELEKDDLLVITGEFEDFYAVVPPVDVKAYIFRTFVLEGLIEGSKVNVRLEPHLDSPIIAQLNSGDRVEGRICESNNKWYEIAPPPSVVFYIYKDYVEKVGDVNYIMTVEERRKDANRLLKWAFELSQEEMQKSFEEIDLNPIVGIIDELISEYPDFPEHTKRAKDLLGLIQDHYLQQKADYLEFKTQENSEEWKEKNLVLITEMESQKLRLKELEKQLEIEKSKTAVNPYDTETTLKKVPALNQECIFSWAVIEEELFEQWQKSHADATMEEYYSEQKETAKTLIGILKPYDRLVKNKPGDFLLVNPKTQTPIAFLYSTDVELQNKIGEEITVQASPRPDNHFAYPAYFVHVVN